MDRLRAKKRAKRIKKMLIQKDLTCAEIARKLGVTRGAVIAVVNGYWPSPRIQTATAEALAMPYEKLWGKKKEKAA